MGIAAAALMGCRSRRFVATIALVGIIAAAAIVIFKVVVVIIVVAGLKVEVVDI